MFAEQGGGQGRDDNPSDQAGRFIEKVGGARISMKDERAQVFHGVSSFRNKMQDGSGFRWPAPGITPVCLGRSVTQNRHNNASDSMVKTIGRVPLLLLDVLLFDYEKHSAEIS
jgi:hypothetical protein